MLIILLCVLEPLRVDYRYSWRVVQGAGWYLPSGPRGHVPGTPLQITADLEALACADICVPLAGRLELDLPDGTAKPSRHAQALAQFAAMVPRLWGALMNPHVHKWREMYYPEILDWSDYNRGTNQLPR